MREITSVTNAYVKDLAKLHDKKNRDSARKFLIEGYHLVQEAKNADLLEEVLIVDINDEVMGVTNTLVTKEIIGKLSKTKSPQDIMGICRYNNDDKLFGKRLLLLDNISDPGNLGTIIRTALGFNIDGIVLSEACVDLYNDKVLRGTQGAIFKIPIFRADLKNVIQDLKSRDIFIIGTALLNSQEIHELKRKDNFALILGNEANGISEDILALTDVNVKIAINEQLESLNVAIAGAILMFYLTN
jgi:TrmH family RNA methyltransferase